MIDALKNTVNQLNLNRFIFVGDRGMHKGNNTSYLLNTNNGYIISKSIEKTTKAEKEWIFDNKDYIGESGSFKYKSKTIKRTVKNENSEKQEIVEKIVVYWSEKFYKKQLAENKSFLEFIKKLEEHPENFRISRYQSRNLKKFMKKECINDDTGEILDSTKRKGLIDYDKINKFKKTFGYYQIVTSELEMSEKKIIETYHGLTRIEREFQTTKSDLDARPLHVRTKEHIEAHLILCMIALTVVRIIQNKIVEYKEKKSDKNWELGLSAERIQHTLNKWTVDQMSNDYYRFNNLDDPDLKLIPDSFDINIPVKLFKKKELKTLKQTIKITT